MGEEMIIQDLKNALENLLDACEYWEDQEDFVLVAARQALTNHENFKGPHMEQDCGVFVRMPKKRGWNDEP